MAHSPSEYQVKAVFLFNLGQFVEWPSRAFEAPSAPFGICVIGEDPIGQVLDDVVRGEFIGARSLIVKHFKDPGEITACNILFIGRGESRHLAGALAAVRGRNVLTVTQVRTFPADSQCDAPFGAAPAMAIDTPSNLRRRLPNWSNPEFVQAVVRVAIVGCTIAFAFSDYSLAHVSTLDNLGTGKRLSVLSGCITTLILLSTILWPSSSLFRRLIGITHDTVAISLAMFLGVEGNVFFGVVYLVVIVGNGIRFGAPYMAYATVCSMLGFGLVYYSNPYWQSNPTLSFYLASILVVVPGYMYGLLNSLHRARAALEQRATHDHLTGLMNRAGIEQRLTDIVGANPKGQVLMFMDLDRFKQVNDNAGHAAGDRLLGEIARVVKSNLRDKDLCARLGGDEFCMLLTDCGMDAATLIAERIRQQVESFRLLWGGRVYSVGASIGVAASDSVSDGKSLLRLADAACYAAKNAGRNSVYVIDASQRISDSSLLRRLGE